MGLTLLVAVLLYTPSCHAGLRARDPDVEVEMEGLRDSESSTFDSAQYLKPHGYRHHSTAGPMRPLLSIPQRPVTSVRETSHQPAQTGNWCAFVHQHVVTMAVLCGTETYKQKSGNPCSKGDPDCQTSKYQISSRPVYRQKEKIFTALHWKCCPGHGGPNCQDTEPENQSSREDTEPTQADVSGLDDSGGKDPDLLDDGSWDDGPEQQPPSGPVFPVLEHAEPGGAIPPSASLPFMDSTTLLTVHQIFAALMAQLQPVLDGFNRTLEHLSSEVEGLSMDLQKLRHRQESHLSNGGQAHSGTMEKKLEGSFVQIRQMQSQLDVHQKQIEQTVRSQEELLQFNFPKLREEIEHRVNQSQEDVQVKLQTLNQSVEEIRLSQENLEEVVQKKYAPSVRVSEGQSTPGPDVWEAINSLDQKVLTNTLDLSALSENSTQLVSVAQKLDRCLQNLSEKLEHLSRSSEIHFAETGLELEAAKVTALNSINELTSNLSSQERQLRELELYLDNIYENVKRNEPAEEACSCKEMSESLITLELKVWNVTDLAKKNQYALEDAEAMKGQSHSPMQVEDLHQALLSVKESLAFEQAKSRTLNDHVFQLKTSLLGSQQEILGLKESFGAKASEIKYLSASFSSLLKDAIRHSEVLEVLIGDEVMEFSGLSESQQKELSIPVLLQRLKLMQEKIETHEDTLASLKRNSAERDQMTSDDPVAFSEWSLTEDQRGNTDDHQEDPYLPGPPTGEDEGDYSVSDFWSLGREVEELAGRLTQLEQHCNCTAAPSGSVVELQREVTALRLALDDHLRIFRNLFSYSDKLANSSRSLNLDQVWSMIRRKDRKRNKGEYMKEKGESSHIRTKRNTGSGPSYYPVAFIANLQQGTNIKHTLLHKKVDVNHGNAYRPPSGEFHAPQTGIYLFLVTLNFEKGPCLAQLKNGIVPVVSLTQEQGDERLLSRACLLELQRGEKLSLQILKGRLRQRPLNENTLSGILLLNTEDKDTP